MPEAQIIRHEGAIAPPCKVKVMKMSKGYQWEISVSGDIMNDVLLQIAATNKVLKDNYGEQGA